MVKANSTHSQGQKEEGCMRLVLSTFAPLYSESPDHETASTTSSSASLLSLIHMATGQPGRVNASFRQSSQVTLYRVKLTAKLLLYVQIMLLLLQ